MSTTTVFKDVQSKVETEFFQGLNAVKHVDRPAIIRWKGYIQTDDMQGFFSQLSDRSIEVFPFLFPSIRFRLPQRN